MTKIKRSEYIIISRTIIRNLFDLGCFGKGSVYINIITSAIPKGDTNKFEAVLEALIKQKIILRKKKKHGWKYYLNREKIDKIKQIIKEKGRISIIPLLLSI